jgi:hypothetical protein
MQIEQAAELESNWKARGDPRCEHPTYEEEYYLGCVTGRVCTTCGGYLDLVNLEGNLSKIEWPAETIKL